MSQFMGTLFMRTYRLKSRMSRRRLGVDMTCLTEIKFFFLTKLDILSCQTCGDVGCII